MPNSKNQCPWISFDCFGTLVDWNTGFHNLLAPLAGPRTGELIRAYHQFEQLVEAERPHLLYRDVLTTSLARAARSLALELPPASLVQLPQSWGQIPVFSDVEPALAALRAAGWKLAVLTNCDDDLFAQTQRNFRLPFDLVITAQQVGSYKPALGHFHRFAEQSHVARENWVHVACSWFHDIAPAKALDIKRIWIDRDQTGEDPAAATVRLPDARELLATVAGFIS